MRAIPIADYRATKLPVMPEVPVVAPPDGVLCDALGRPLRDLRISVTDRCNFRCSYCMPKEVFGSNYAFLPQGSLLSFEETARLARLFVTHGVQKIRLTGGEPLLRKNLEALVAMLAPLRTPEGKPVDLTLTTNGSLLARKAAALKDAGLGRVTVSLDALDELVFGRMNDVDFPVASVLEGIEVARCVGLDPIKVNMVVKRGVNDDQIIPMASHFRGSNVVLRFIEYMDVGATNGWRMHQVLPSLELVERLDAQFPLEQIEPNCVGETAERWRYRDGGGEIGVISSVTRAFCGDCNRARLSAEGKLFLCLFASQGHDLRSMLRAMDDGGRLPIHTDDEVAAAIRLIWQQRVDRYSEQRRSMQTDTGESVRRVEMHYIGG